MRSGEEKPRGFAALFAIVLLGLAASAVVFLSASLVRDAARLRAEEADAQLRVILQEQAGLAVKGGRTPALPRDLTAAGYGVIVERGGGETQTTFTIKASANGRMMTERVKLESGKAVEVRLLP